MLVRCQPQQHPDTLDEARIQFVLDGLTALGLADGNLACKGRVAPPPPHGLQSEIKHQICATAIFADGVLEWRTHQEGIGSITVHITHHRHVASDVVTQGVAIHACIVLCDRNGALKWHVKDIG